VDNRIAAAPGDDPNHVLVTVIHLLMLCIGWYEGEISGRKLLSLRTIRAADNGAMTARSVNDCVCCASDGV
jgi:hypothetical protein